MNSRMRGRFSGASAIAAGVGLLAGVTAGLLLVPMRGSQMRASLRNRADRALDRGMALVEEGRRVFGTAAGSPASVTPASVATAAAPLTATIGEIAQLHEGPVGTRIEAQS